MSPTNNNMKVVEFMYMKKSETIRNNYNEIANLCKETDEPTYLAKNGEGSEW
jgi:hypothetical protein